MRSISFVMMTLALTLLLGFTTGVPLKQRASRLDLKARLGDSYDTYSKLEGDLKLMFLKEYIRTPPDKRDEVQKKWKDIVRQHVPAHSPGSVEQLHETWRADDHMDDDSYSPEALFRTHDYDNDGYLSGPEIRALYYSQLERAYPDHNEAEDTLREMESTRMFAKLMGSLDVNRDGKVSLQEFTSYRPQHDEDYDWVDEDDLPSLDQVEGDTVLEDAVRRDLNAHPSDEASEELMHRISGKVAIPGTPTIRSYSHHQDHHEPHGKPVAASAQPPTQQSSTSKPSS